MPPASISHCYFQTHLVAQQNGTDSSTGISGSLFFIPLLFHLSEMFSLDPLLHPFPCLGSTCDVTCACSLIEVKLLVFPLYALYDVVDHIHICIIFWLKAKIQLISYRMSPILSSVLNTLLVSITMFLASSGVLLNVPQDPKIHMLNA